MLHFLLYTSIFIPLLFFLFCFFFFNDTATTEIYTLSLHDALPIYPIDAGLTTPAFPGVVFFAALEIIGAPLFIYWQRSEEHTSELQSRLHLVCRLLLEKKKKKTERILAT